MVRYVSELIRTYEPRLSKARQTGHINERVSGLAGESIARFARRAKTSPKKEEGNERANARQSTCMRISRRVASHVKTAFPFLPPPLSASKPSHVAERSALPQILF